MVIDTYNCIDIWTSVFGYGTLQKISKITVDISINDMNFFENVQEIITRFMCEMCENDFRETENKLIKFNSKLKCEDFNNYEQTQMRSIVSNW